MSCTIRTAEELQILRDQLEDYRQHRDIVDAVLTRPLQTTYSIETEVMGRRLLISETEVMEVIRRRADAIANELQNKGIKLAFDDVEPLASIRRRHSIIAGTEGATSND